MNRIDAFFSKGQRAFIPYVTAGYPSVEETGNVLRLLVQNGADIIELGFPFSDPTADGPVLQVSSQESLLAGFRRNAYFDLVADFRAEFPETPLVVFSYYNPIFSYGTKEFVARVAEAGADALLVVDLPYEEQGELRPYADEAGLHLIQLIAPTTPEERARKILANAGGFVYQIARRGVTGMRSELSDEAVKQSARLRGLTKLPIALGFGVADGTQAAAIAKATDGVIVGSAIVKTITDHLSSYQEPLAAQIRELAEATHGAG